MTAERPIRINVNWAKVHQMAAKEPSRLAVFWASFTVAVGGAFGPHMVPRWLHQTVWAVVWVFFAGLVGWLVER